MIVSPSELDIALLAAPFAAGLLVLATHIPLGIDVLRRGIVFIDLAVAQVATVGVIAASWLGLDQASSGYATQAAAAVAAITGALFLTWTDRRWPELQEALIGLLYVLAAATSILMLAQHPHGGEHLRDLLTGQILWVNWQRLGPAALLYAGVLIIWFGVFRGRSGRETGFGFYLLFAIVVTVSVQLVGVLLVFASLIAPAVASRGHPDNKRLPAAYAIGAFGYAVGLLLSLLADFPAGAMVVCVLCILAAIGLLHQKR